MLTFRANPCSIKNLHVYALEKTKLCKILSRVISNVRPTEVMSRLSRKWCSNDKANVLKESILEFDHGDESARTTWVIFYNLLFPCSAFNESLNHNNCWNDINKKLNHNCWNWMKLNFLNKFCKFLVFLIISGFPNKLQFLPDEKY